MRIAVIINPISGRRRRRSGEPAARVALARATVPGSPIEVTTGAGHATALAREYAAAGIDVVLAWGGDGTVNEVAGPLIGTRTALGIVPSGSGDGLARGLGVPREPRAAIARVLSGHRMPIDTGVLGSRHFLNIAGIGFDAAVATAFNRRTRRGLAAYLRGAVGGVWTYRPAIYALSLDGEERTGRYFLAAFANGPQYGNGLEIAPDADPADGLLNLVLVGGGSPFRQIWRARRLALAPLRPAEGVLRRLVRRATVEGERLVCHVDGESFEASGRIDVTVRPASLTVAGIGTSVGSGFRRR